MPYKINNTSLALQPSAGKWIPRETVGTDGNGHPVYPAVRQFEMKWDLITEAEFYELQNMYDTLMYYTGSTTATLPRYKPVSGVYTYDTYTGCIIHEPEATEFFELHRINAKMLIVNIRT
jgi:hypothetical protein